MENYEDIESNDENKYNKGFIEGKEISAKQSFEYGYKDGIQSGLEIGYYNAFIKSLIDIYPQLESKVVNKQQYKKLKTLLNKYKEIEIDNQDIQEKEVTKLKNLNKMIHSILNNIKTSNDNKETGNSDVNATDNISSNIDF